MNSPGQAGTALVITFHWLAPAPAGMDWCAQRAGADLTRDESLGMHHALVG
jgi:hypothetical protein